MNLGPALVELIKPPIVVGMGEYRVGAGPGTVVTYALGSCVGLTAYDPLNRVGGLLHYMLPTATTTPPEKPDEGRYLDHALPRFLDRLTESGAQKRFLEFKAFGGADTAKLSLFDVANRNIAALKELSVRLRIFVRVWEVGGRDYRTVSLDLSNGKVLVRTSLETFYR
ncbi:MAG: chemotaxis protein CheD [Verrucomicrobiae bacterium]|nr:chemotaxis protein CheD [Verrucomicrobiae bacterium]